MAAAAEMEEAKEKAKAKAKARVRKEKEKESLKMDLALVLGVVSILGELIRHATLSTSVPENAPEGTRADFGTTCLKHKPRHARALLPVRASPPREGIKEVLKEVKRAEKVRTKVKMQLQEENNLLTQLLLRRKHKLMQPLSRSVIPRWRI